MSAGNEINNRIKRQTPAEKKVNKVWNFSC